LALTSTLGKYFRSPSRDDIEAFIFEQAFPDAVSPPPGGRLHLAGIDLAGWLRRL
jgi:hypothetical protein